MGGGTAFEKRQGSHPCGFDSRSFRQPHRDGVDVVWTGTPKGARTPSTSIAITGRRDLVMFGLLAVITFGLDFILVGLKATTNSWFSGTALIALGLAFLALHLLGASERIRNL